MAGLADDLTRRQVRKTLGQGIAGVIALSLACNVGALSVPLFNMQVFNRVLTTRSTETLAALSAGLVIAMIVYALIDHVRAGLLDALADHIVQLLSLPLLRAAAAAPSGRSLHAQSLEDLETVRGFVGSPVCAAPFELAWAPFLFVVLGLLHPLFAALAIVCAATLLALNMGADAASRRQTVAASTEAAMTLQDVGAAARSAEAVVAMGMLPSLMRVWRQRSGAVQQEAARALLRMRAIAALTRTLRMAMTGTMVALGLVLAIEGNASGGSMVAANMILARLLLPFDQISGTYRLWVEALAAWQRIRATLAIETTARYTAPLPSPIGSLVVDRLVSIPAGADRAILRGVSFTLPPGEILGVIGPSASGKSTLLRHILGMEAPTSGSVTLDGHSTFLWEREDFARHVAYVPQSLALTDACIADNIARLSTPDLQKVIAAARRTGVHRAIAGQPLGYATPLRATSLSAGERQRIALARALYGAPKLLVLDEPTAFLDEAGEAMLVSLLRTTGISTVVVTHRPRLIAAVDRLLVVRDGVVERFGQRDDVLRALQGPRIQHVRREAV